jgi:hypothetical protein
VSKQKFSTLEDERGRKKRVIREQAELVTTMMTMTTTPLFAKKRETHLLRILRIA